MSVGTMERERGAAAGAARPWPLAARVTAGLVLPGGEEMALRALEGIGLEEGDRVLELSPGLGAASELTLRRGPREWTAVEPDPLAVEHLERTLGATPGRRVVAAPLDATGLPDEAFSAVVADGALSSLAPPARAAALAEAARLLRPEGRLAIHDLVLAEGAAQDPALDGELEALGLWAEPLARWREAVEATGLVVLGTTAGPLRLRQPRDLMREAGPRAALRMARAVALDGRLRSIAAGAHGILESQAGRLRAGVLVAEKPLIRGLRRARR